MGGSRSRSPPAPDMNEFPTARQLMALACLVCAAGQSTAGGVPAVEVPAGAHPAVLHLERGLIEMRTDPEASKRDADEALRLLEKQPDADLEVQARLLLCDYQAERDTQAAEQEIEAGTALLPKAQRQGLRAGLLDCRGQMYETAGNNAKARALYEQAVTVAAETHDDEMLAQSLFSRGLPARVGRRVCGGLERPEARPGAVRQSSTSRCIRSRFSTHRHLYNRMGDNSQAVYIYSRALKAQREAGMQREQAVTLHNLGRAYENLHQWDEARKAFAGSLAVSRQLGYPRGEAYGLRGLAAVANASGDPAGRVGNAGPCRTLQRQTPDARLRAQIQLARGVALHKLDRLPESTAALEDALGVLPAGRCACAS